MGVRQVQAQPSEEATVDYILLVDKSGSMVGLPSGTDAVDIFPEVKQSINRFLGDLEAEGNEVLVATFSDGLEEVKQFSLRSRADMERAQSYVSGLEATGSQTYVYQSLLDIFKRYKAFRKESGGGQQRVGMLMVYTDGLDNSPDGRSMEAVLREFESLRQKNDYLYYSTLGVDLPQNVREALKKSPFARWVDNESGEVKPARIVEPRYKRLDFGNLMEQPGATRTMRFDVRGELPAGFRLDATAVFDSVSQQSAAVEVNPATVDPSGEVALSLELINKQSLGKGYYTGTIRFEPSDSSASSVVVAPGRVEARFRYQPKRSVKVQPAPGADELSASFGSVDPFRTDSARARSMVALPLRYNQEARAKGGAFTVRVEQDDEPPRLPKGALRINGQEGRTHAINVEDGEDLRFDVSITEEAEPGTYRGRLVLQSNAVEVDSASQEIPWRVEVPSPPRTAGEWALIVLFALLVLLAVGVVIYRLLKGRWPPPFQTVELSGRLTVVAPPDDYNQQVLLKGKRRVSVGSGGDELPDAEARIVVRAEANGQTIHPKVRVEEGNATIRHPGEEYDVPIGSETLGEGDQLTVQPYTLEYSPY